MIITEEFIIPAVFITVTLAVFLLSHLQSKRFEPILERQAGKWNGKVKPGFLFFFPKLIWQHEKGEITVHSMSGGKNSPPFTHFKCTLNRSANYRINLFREIGIHKFGKALGMKDIQIHVPEFDDKFIIQGDESTASSFFTPEIQVALLRLRGNGLLLRIEGVDVKLSVPKFLKEQAEYDQLIETGLLLLEQL